MKYNIILFDADETLYDFKQSEKVAFKNTMLYFKLEYKEEYHLNIYSDINTVVWKEFEQGLITQEDLKVERFKRLFKVLNLNFDEHEFANKYMDYLAESSILYDGIEELIELLYKNYQLYVVTNGLSKVQDKRIRKSKIAKYFEDIIVSEEVGVSKPDPKIFELALKNIKDLDKGKVLMVGDSLSSDIKGGNNFGIDTCWYNPKHMVNSGTVKATYEIENLSELLTILEY